MATTLNSIITQARILMAQSLGSTWKRHHWNLELAKNDFEMLGKAYSIVPGEAVNVETVARYYTMDRTFSMRLSDNMGTEEGDEKYFTVVKDLDDKLDEIFQLFVSAHLNLAGTVMNIKEPGLSAPEVIAAQSVVLNMDFVVTYRQPITYS